MQIILAIGNYMNSSKRGGVFGFRLQTLDIVSAYTLLHTQCFIYACITVKLIAE